MKGLAKSCSLSAKWPILKSHCSEDQIKICTPHACTKTVHLHRHIPIQVLRNKDKVELFFSNLFQICARPRYLFISWESCSFEAILDVLVQHYTVNLFNAELYWTRFKLKILSSIDCMLTCVTFQVKPDPGPRKNFARKILEIKFANLSTICIMLKEALFHQKHSF